MKRHHKVELVKKPEWFDTDIDPKQTITVPWHNQDNEWWNETCASVLTVFGLPGQRFYYRPYPNYMTFTFKSKKDADLCKVLLSEKIADV